MFLSCFLEFLVSLVGITGVEGKKKYCTFCGHPIPMDAAFCPNCGIIQSPQREIPKQKLSQRMAQNRRKIRVILFFASLVLFLLTFLVGTQAQMSGDEARAVVESFEETVGRNLSAQTIIMNNTIICIQFFIPILGMISLAEVGFNTGYVLAAYALTDALPANALTYFLLTIVNPVAWIEFAAYSLASSEGTMMMLSILFRFLRKEARDFLLALIVATSLLILGGFLEMSMINAIRG